MRDWMKASVEKSGGIPLPEGVVMTKAQFLDHNARSEAAKAAFIASGGGAAPGFGTPGGMSGPGGGMGVPGGGFGGPGGGMGGRNQNPEDRAIGRMREQDRNQDGKVAFDEADSRLKENWKVIDANNDGYVDLDEYKGYYVAQSGGRGPGGPGGGFDPNNPNGGWGPGGEQRPFEKKDTEEERPVAMRYGKLPKDLPEWFDKLDDDKDGQVGLYEWRKAGKDMAEFTGMDLNADGLVTADEYLRFARQKSIQTKVETYEETGSRPASWGIGATVPGAGDASKGKGAGMFNKGDERKTEERKDERKSEKGNKGGDNTNPWAKKSKN